MSDELSGKRVAFVLTDGFEDSELTDPWEALTDAGAANTLISPTSGEVEGKKGYRQRVDLAPSLADADEFDALVLPGGVVNADHLRMDADAVALVSGFVDAGKPIGVICHGAWILIEAGGVEGRQMTSYPSLQTDLRNAGAEWVDEEVVVDGGLVTSRRPTDLPAFDRELVRAIAAAPAADLV